jgi:flagellar protein FlaJ
MRFKIETRHIAGILIGLVLIGISYFFLYDLQSRWYKPLIALGLFGIIFQFWLDAIREGQRQVEIEEKFLEFMRSISDGVKAGIPIPRAIRELSDTDFGALTPYVRKLINQIEWSIPLRSCLLRFARDTNNPVVKRSVSIIIEAEQGGGNISGVLTSVTNSILQIKKIKNERRSNTFSQIIQGYVVFFIFIGIMIILQVYLLPQLSDIGGVSMTGFQTGLNGGVGTGESIDFNVIFTALIIIQGLFSGLVVGKFSEGSLLPGLKHSLIMVLFGYLIFSTVVGF